MVAFTGCYSLNTNQMNGPIGVHVVAPMKADVSVKMSDKVEGTADVTTLFGFINLGTNKYADGMNYGVVSANTLGFMSPFMNPNTAAASAAYDAAKKSGADVIVAPKYELEVTDYFVVKFTKARVTGYKGTVNSITMCDTCK